MRSVIDNGGTSTVIQLNNDGSLTTGTVQDCTAILEHAQARHKEGLHGSSEMKLAASIPFVLVEKYCNDRGIEFREFMASEDHKKAILNDPALSYFRIWNGKI